MRDRSLERLSHIETPRLLLHRLQEAHRVHMRQMDSNPAVVGVDGVRSAEQSDRFVDQQLEHWDRHGFGIWILFEKETLTCAGRGGLRHVELEGRQVVQIGYGFFPRFWGKGLATELALASTRAGFDVIGLPRLVALVLPSNRASQRVLEKAGFTYKRDAMYEGARHMVYESTNPTAASLHVSRTRL